MRTILAAQICAVTLIVGLSGCERPPVETVQGGYRGLAMQQEINPRLDAAKAHNNVVPAPIPPGGGTRSNRCRCFSTV